MEFDVDIPVGAANLQGVVSLPGNTGALVIFAHGSGSSRFSPRNLLVSKLLLDAGIGTLLFDLLTHEEDEIDRYTRKYRFDIGLLAHRLEEVSRWVGTQLQLRELRLGYFGASTGSAAALIAASNLRHVVKAVVSRGGRPDLAEHVLPDVLAPTLLIVGELDEEVIEVNRHAFGLLTCEKELQIVPGASHLFEEPATLELAGALAADWFHDHLSAGAPPRQVPETAHAVR